MNENESCSETYINIKCKYSDKRNINQKLIGVCQLMGRTSLSSLNLYTAMTLATFLFIKISWWEKHSPERKDNICIVTYFIQK